VNKVLVTGASGFIAHHLGKYLREQGFWVRGVDYQPMPFGEGVPDECYDEFWYTCDLRSLSNAIEAVGGMDHVYTLAADMGGMGFISTNHWQILSNNASINMNIARAVASASYVTRLFYTSSACVYPVRLQKDAVARNLKESDAWLGSPEDAYGVEKLMAEQLYLRMSEQTGIKVRIARFHNIYGPEGTWRGGREKLPAAACRKIAEQDLESVAPPQPVEVWGDGKQTRSFCYIDDCVEMIFRLMFCPCPIPGPVNIGTDELVSVNDVYDIVAAVAGIQIEKVHDLDKPQGVRGRNADLTLMRRLLDYEPQYTFAEGIAKTYPWVRRRVKWLQQNSDSQNLSTG
jgi:nucleoside-diphosphate-sugar epimerase